MVKQYCKYFILFSLSLMLIIFTLFRYTQAQIESTAPITIYVAKKIITMDPTQPEATAVAVKDNHIYSVGSLDDMKTWMKEGSYTVNNAFIDDVITPGFIEAHSHWTLLAILLNHPYVGYFDFPSANGNLPGIKTKADVIQKLKDEDKKLANPYIPLFAWQYDPIYFNNADLTTDDLDQISKTRPIFVLNASGHIGYANSVLLNKAGIGPLTTTKGVMKDKNGNPTGVLLEIAAMEPVLTVVLPQIMSQQAIQTGIKNAGMLAQKLGLTTVSDLFFGGANEDLWLQELKSAANNPQYPVRVVAVYGAPILMLMEQQKAGAGFAHLNSLIAQNSNKLRFGEVKFVVDGSIQGFTSRLNWPGYFNGAPNGIFNLDPENFKKQALLFWQGGYPIRVHVNGDEATDVALDTLQYLQTAAPSRSNIFVLEHDQLSSPERFKRTRDLGAYVDLFPNHIYFWGDQHYSITLGPDRANKMDNAQDAIKNGLIYSFHTDSPITRLGPLHSMWAGVNRVTASGRILGPNLRISAEDALRAVTINAAYLLNLQNDIGSISVGKRADFTVLANDPLTVPVETIKDVPVVATISDGVVFPVTQS
ncbi:MAG: hypothetical protein ACD_46C00254G0002 [uncultured bacterium]|nr:MAG: hypothetical protein ACD_46C00254G0002 [uncultured bacterium]